MRTDLCGPSSIVYILRHPSGYVEVFRSVKSTFDRGVLLAQRLGFRLPAEQDLLGSLKDRAGNDTGFIVERKKIFD